MARFTYTEANIKSLDWKEHIRLRPGMYIGKLGNGDAMDDGIYILIKEVLDNCIDEYVMGYGDSIEIKIEEGSVSKEKILYAGVSIIILDWRIILILEKRMPKELRSMDWHIQWGLE